MKKLSQVLIFCLLFSSFSSLPAFAEDYPDLSLLPPMNFNAPLLNCPVLLKESPNDKEFKPTKGAYDGQSVSMPLSFWDETRSPYGGKLKREGRKITLKKNGKTFIFKINSNIVNLDGKNYCFFGRTCYKVNDEIHLPLRFILEQTEGIFIDCKGSLVDKSPIYITLDSSKKVSKPFPERDHRDFDYKSEVRNFPAISPNKKWEVKVTSLGSGCALYLKDVEKKLFYPLVFASPRISAAWTDDNKLLFEVLEITYAGNDGDRLFQYDPETKSISPYEDVETFYKYYNKYKRSDYFHR